MQLYFAGIIAAVGSAGTIIWGTWNWSKTYDGTFDFPVNASQRQTDYIDIGGKSQIKTAQTEGKSKCKYALYTAPRYGKYTMIYADLTYKKNNKATSAYSYNFGKLYDYKFKMKKQAGISYYSNVKMKVGVE